MKKGRMMGLAIGIVFLFSSSVSAAIIVDDWTLNLTGVDGLGTTVVNDIGQIVFNGIAHAENPAFPDPGLGYVDGLLNTENFKNTAGTTISPIVSGVNVTYQLTFDFSVDTLYSALSGNSIDFTHPASTLTDGFLDIYVDATVAAGGSTFTAATNTTPVIGGVNTFTDGQWIAKFEIVPGGGGTYFTGTQDGSDDATFSLVSALPNTIFDKFGNDLSLIGTDLLVVTDSNFDTDPLNTGSAFAIGDPTWTNLPGAWPFAANGYGSPSSFFAEEDGSARIGVIPEPSTFLLLGVGLFGLAYVGRKRASK